VGGGNLGGSTPRPARTPAAPDGSPATTSSRPRSVEGTRERSERVGSADVGRVGVGSKSESGGEDRPRPAPASSGVSRGAPNAVGQLADRPGWGPHATPVVSRQVPDISRVLRAQEAPTCDARERVSARSSQPVLSGRKGLEGHEARRVPEGVSLLTSSRNGPPSRVGFQEGCPSLSTPTPTLPTRPPRPGR
jgi:hypothetical protein